MRIRHLDFDRRNSYPVQRVHHLKAGGRIHTIRAITVDGFFRTVLLYHQSEGMGRLNLFAGETMKMKFVFNYFINEAA